jgi:hypothetical protein
MHPATADMKENCTLVSLEGRRRIVPRVNILLEFGLEAGGVDD